MDHYIECLLWGAAGLFIVGPAFGTAIRQAWMSRHEAL
jgi:hypothetical protein